MTSLLRSVLVGHGKALGAFGITVALVGGGSAGMMLASDHSPTSGSIPAVEASESPDPSESPEPSETPKASESPEASESPDATHSPEPSESPNGEHGACVSRVAQTAPVHPTAAPQGEDDHGLLVRAAAHACGRHHDADGHDAPQHDATPFAGQTRASEAPDAGDTRDR